MKKIFLCFVLAVAIGSVPAAAYAYGATYKFTAGVDVKAGIYTRMPASPALDGYAPAGQARVYADVTGCPSQLGAIHFKFEKNVQYAPDPVILTQERYAYCAGPLSRTANISNGNYYFTVTGQYYPQPAAPGYVQWAR